MIYELAPMEALTGYIFRNAHRKHFTAADRYISPFIASKELSSRERNDILPEHNEGIDLVPQILTNHADEFIYIANKLSSEYGYKEVNLNLGCPSGTVVSKNRGSGFLKVLDELKLFLDEIYEKSPVPISIKTRIGFSNLDAWEEILDLYNEYPVKELIIHPRTREDAYTGNIHMDCFLVATEKSKNPITFNGDICKKSDEEKLKTIAPSVSSVMCGRGVLKNPALFEELKEEPTLFTEDRLLSFLSDLVDDYSKVLSGDRNVMFKVKELWNYLYVNYEKGDKLVKKIRKSNDLHQYQAVLNEIHHYHFIGN